MRSPDIHGWVDYHKPIKGRSRFLHRKQRGGGNLQSGMPNRRIQLFILGGGSSDARREKNSSSSCLICTDFLSLAQAFQKNNWKNPNEKLKEIKRTLSRIEETIVTILWIPFHVKIHGTLPMIWLTMAQEGHRKLSRIIV